MGKKYQNEKKTWTWHELLDHLKQQKEHHINDYKGGIPDEIYVGDFSVWFNNGFYKLNYEGENSESKVLNRKINLSGLFNRLQITEPETIIRAIYELKTGKLTGFTRATDLGSGHIDLQKEKPKPIEEDIDI